MGVQVDDLIVPLCDIGILTCSLLTIWCPRGDLNPHALAGTSTSS